MWKVFDDKDLKNINEVHKKILILFVNGKKKTGKINNENFKTIYEYTCKVMLLIL